MRLLRGLFGIRCPLCRERRSPSRMDAHINVDHFGEVAR